MDDPSDAAPGVLRVYEVRIAAVRRATYATRVVSTTPDDAADIALAHVNYNRFDGDGGIDDSSVHAAGVDDYGPVPAGYPLPAQPDGGDLFEVDLNGEYHACRLDLRHSGLYRELEQWDDKHVREIFRARYEFEMRCVDERIAALKENEKKLRTRLDALADEPDARTARARLAEIDAGLVKVVDEADVRVAALLRRDP